MEELRDFLTGHLSWPAAREAVLLCVIALLAAISYFVMGWLMKHVERLVKYTATTIDDILLNDMMRKALSRLVPALVVNWLLPQLYNNTTSLYSWITTLTALYVLVAVIYVCIVLVRNLYHLMEDSEKTRRYAVKGIFQMVRLVIVCIGVIIGLSIILGREPVAIVTAIGASAAVLMLVFKDTILGLVASVQLSANNMLRKGDWLVCDSHGINGTVTDVSLTTVKVLNWDNSVSTIPPYTLVTDSFRNYQAMRDSGGRRVERSILIDINTVRFLDAIELERLKARGRLDGMDAAAGGDMVNLHLLRLYLEKFIGTDSRVNASMLFMVRQMAPTPQGLPLQLYFFTNTTEWREYERVQSDMFDHVYAIINEFGLRIYQAPAGSDISRLAHGSFI
ncbi:MAG: mechanosensitive ion channel family protein [Muribaculaceae bacterium]|nr:mechanosensitive ion channel family protein [Muribaculaceae bacterium]